MESSIYRRTRQITQALTQRNNFRNSSIPSLNNRYSEALHSNRENMSMVGKQSKHAYQYLQKFKTQEPRTNISHYIQLMKSKVLSNSTNFKSLNKRQFIKVNIKKKYRQMAEINHYTQRKFPKPKSSLTEPIKQIIDKIMETYEFVKETHISKERLSRLVRIATNDDRLLCKIFLNSTKYEVKGSERSKYQVIFNKKTIISNFEKVFKLFKKSSQDVLAVLNLFYEKLDNLVHQMDNNIMREVQRSVLKYNALIQNMNYEMPIAINKQKYNSQNNLLLQLKANEKNLGQCKNISRISRKRYELLESIVSKIKEDPLW